MEQLKQLLTAAGIAYKENEPLAAHCTFKIGGPARLFVQPADRAQLCRAVALCKAQGVRYYLLGNGSNILFADEGYNGVVLDISSMQDTVEVHGTQLTAGAGVRLSALCKTALEHGLTGLEFAYGIPGTVGGAVYMNAGAYGGEMKDVLTTVQYLTAEGEVKEAAAAELDLRYRHSIFEENGALVLIDYKTDKVKNEDELLGRYKNQIRFYRNIAAKSLQKNVKEAGLYSFYLGKVCKY